MDNFLNAGIIEAIGKLSVEVVAIIALLLIVKWIAHANEKLSASHGKLSDSITQYSITHDRLVTAIKGVSNAVKRDVKLTEDLINQIKNNKCNFKNFNHKKNDKN